MSNFQSYSSYVPQPEEIYSTGPQFREDAPVHRVSSSGGAITESAEQSYDTGHSGQINPHAGTNAWQATARTTSGHPVSEITADSLVEFDGVQAKVSFWLAEGRLSKAADGSFTEAEVQAQAPQVSQGDLLPISDAVMNVVNAALEPLPDSDLDMVVAQGIGVALGRLDDASLTAKFSQASGLDHADSHERLTTIKAIYQEQADNAVETRSGIGASDRAEFWNWARANHGGQLQEAIGKQLRGHDVSGYAALANQWLSATAPSIAALQAAGIPTRTQSQGPECFISGLWMSPAAAAKAGLI